MHERALRTVLFIRSIDEGDPSGEVLTLAERSEATKAAAAKADGKVTSGLAGSALHPAAEKLLVRRAELLQDKLEARSPVVGRLLDLAGGASWLGPAILLAAFGAGVAMSALDGSQRVDMLAFPLLGLIGWNLVVFGVLVATAIRSRRNRKKLDPSSPLTNAYARWVRARADALLQRSSRFHVPLSAAMQRFAQDWAAISRPLVLLRGKRLFHLGGALVAVGLIAGLYVRGLVLRYDAGWESTFLDAPQVRAVLGLLYGPASALSGIELPSVDEVAALRWGQTGTGEAAGDWIHLIALTALLYVVVPRLIAVAFVSAALWRAERHPELPASFAAYARRILRETGGVSGITASVTTYAYAPSRDALAGLSALLGDALGGDVKAEVRTSVAYGEEDSFAKRARKEGLPESDCHVLLMSSAATPERENHGAIIDAMREATRGGSGLLLVVDESPYAARMEGDPAFATRVAERARTWRDFAAARSQPACIVDLSRLRTGDTPDDASRTRVREALQRFANA